MTDRIVTDERTIDAALGITAASEALREDRSTQRLEWKALEAALVLASAELAQGRVFAAYAMVNVAARYEYMLTSSADRTAKALDALEKITSEASQGWSLSFEEILDLRIGLDGEEDADET